MAEGAGGLAGPVARAVTGLFAGAALLAPGGPGDDQETGTAGVSRARPAGRVTERPAEQGMIHARGRRLALVALAASAPRGYGTRGRRPPAPVTGAGKFIPAPTGPYSRVC